MSRALVLAVFGMLGAGCSAGAGDVVRLVLISPHRDEIRYEYDQAFPDWIARRTRERIERTLSCFDAGEDATAALVLEELLRDWDRKDIPKVYSEYERWCLDADAGRAPLREALEDWRRKPRPVQLVWQDVGGGTSAIVLYLRSSFGAADERGKAGIDVDLMFGGGTDVYLRFAEEGFLQAPDPLPVGLERIPRELNGTPMYDPNHRWFGPMLSSFGILSNRWVLERMRLPEPATWSDLGRPELLGWINVSDMRISGSMHMVYEIILQGPLGWDDGFSLLMRIGANAHTVIRDSGTLTRSVYDGEVGAAANLDVNSLSAVARNPEMMKYTLPEGQTIINPDALALLRGAPRPHLARAFIEYSLSEEGQRLLLLRPGLPGGPVKFPMCRLSVLPELYQQIPREERAAGTVNPFEVKGTIRYDSALGIRRWDALNDVLGAWAIDAHRELTVAAQAVRDSNLTADKRAELERMLFAAPCTEDDLLHYAKLLSAGNVRFRTIRLTEWGKEARVRYQEIRNRCRAAR